MHHSGEAVRVFLKVCLKTSGRVRPCDKITFEKFNRCETIKVKRTVCEHLEGTDRDIGVLKIHDDPPGNMTFYI